jgi:Mg/Co/Ni transporter MgtE
MRIRRMTDVPPLTIAYLERLPESAARVIAGMRPADAAALFEAVPTRILAPVVEKMEKWPAALCLQLLSNEKAAAIVAEVSYQSATVLLRLAVAERRGAILGQLRSGLARDLRESLRYPRNTVGAWMDLSVPTLSLGATVEAAVAVVRAANGRMTDPIFVVDDNQNLAGVLRAEALLRHAGNTRIAGLVETGLVPLFARTLLRDAAALAAWDDYSCLPVASRLGQMLGTLARGDLKRGLATISAVSAPADADGGASVWSNMGEAMLASMAGLLDLIGDDSPGRNARKET